MSRNILLVEPGYKTKFPPMGLMKISTYHKMLGDNVLFNKGTNITYDIASIFWDRIYISTMFTYNWKITVDTIMEYKKKLVDGDSSRIFIGGILASLMFNELWNETGIVPIRGLLDQPGALGDKNQHIIDQLIPDYSLFNNINHEYSLIKDSYFGYSTKGCIHKCKFCGVPKLEPKYVDYLDIKSYVNAIKTAYGEKHHLVLMDNNVLASSSFNKIINDIKDLGFEKGSKLNNKLRYVDFNQGNDARLIVKDKSKMKLLSEIAIHPLRIAFDHISLKTQYTESIHLAAKYGIKYLSNYILYNYNDTPEDLWERLKLNIDLNSDLKLSIYSFPMKYIPLDHKNRSYINEPNWNWYYIRGVQRILNVLKGSVMTNSEFFTRAFGESKEEFIKILHMPEKLLMNRTRNPQKDEKIWSNKFDKLSDNEKRELLGILNENRTIALLSKITKQTKNRKLKSILEFYEIDTTETDIEYDNILPMSYK